jgi:hypothetical protein
MKTLLVSLLFVLACGGPTKKPEGSMVQEGSDVPQECCCKTTPLTSEDGKPVYAQQNRMECSTKQGECVPEVQCQAQTPVEPSAGP